MKEAGAHAVKLEGGVADRRDRPDASSTRASRSWATSGSRRSRVHQFGGWKVQGKTTASSDPADERRARARAGRRVRRRAGARPDAARAAHHAAAARPDDRHRRGRWTATARCRCSTTCSACSRTLCRSTRSSTRRLGDTIRGAIAEYAIGRARPALPNRRAELLDGRARAGRAAHDATTTSSPRKTEAARRTAPVDTRATTSPHARRGTVAEMRDASSRDVTATSVSCRRWATCTKATSRSFARRAQQNAERRREHLRQPDAVRPERGLRALSARRGARPLAAPRRARRRRLHAVGRGDVPRRRLDVRRGRRHHGRARRRAPPGPLSRRDDRRREALQHRRTDARLLRAEGRPAARSSSAR